MGFLVSLFHTFLASDAGRAPVVRRRRIVMERSANYAKRGNSRFAKICDVTKPK
jgi:hypothetical protein